MLWRTFQFTDVFTLNQTGIIEEMDKIQEPDGF